MLNGVAEPGHSDWMTTNSVTIETVERSNGSECKQKPFTGEAFMVTLGFMRRPVSVCLLFRKHNKLDSY